MQSLLTQHLNAGDAPMFHEVLINVLGHIYTVQLEEGGSDKLVTEENKKEYSKAVARMFMTDSIEKPILAFK
jgi:hypothetical protein